MHVSPIFRPNTDVNKIRTDGLTGALYTLTGAISQHSARVLPHWSIKTMNEWQFLNCHLALRAYVNTCALCVTASSWEW